MVIAQLILNGIIAGGIYALVAVGFSMNWKLKKFLDVSHGALYAIGAYLAFFLVASGLSIITALVVSLLGTAFFSIIIDRGIYKHLRARKTSSLMFLLASLGVYIVVENLLLALFGADVRTLRTGPIVQGYDILGASITPAQINIIIAALISFLLLYIFLTKTKTGKAMRATADNPSVAQAIGINIERVILYTAGIAGALAALAGVLVGIEQNLEPTMGLFIIIKAFIAAVIGGIGSIPGALAGGFVLGIVENIGIFWLPSGFKDAIAFVVLIMFLIFRPQGIFGKKERT
jgi:branched-chain amino acid transport system permease protein